MHPSVRIPDGCVPDLERDEGRAKFSKLLDLAVDETLNGARSFAKVGRVMKRFTQILFHFPWDLIQLILIFYS